MTGLIVVNPEIPVAAQVGHVGAGPNDDLLRRGAGEEAAVEIRRHGRGHLALQHQVGVAGQVVELEQDPGHSVGDEEVKEELLRRSGRRGKEAAGRRRHKGHAIGQRNDHRRVGVDAGLGGKGDVGGGGVEDAHIPAVGLDGEGRAVGEDHDDFIIRARLLADVVVMVEVRERQMLAEDDGQVAVGAGEPEGDLLGRRRPGGSLVGHVELQVARDAGRTDDTRGHLAIGEGGDVKPDPQAKGDGNGVGIGKGEDSKSGR